jgi:RNA recognition motif-containing protein
MEIKKKRVFVNDLSVDVTEKEILNFFLRYGEIYAVFLKKKFVEQNCSVGITYCFITFKEETTKEKVLLEKGLLKEQYGMNIVESIEESKILNRIKYTELVELTNHQGVSITHNYFEKTKRFDY